MNLYYVVNKIGNVIEIKADAVHISGKYVLLVENLPLQKDDLFFSTKTIAAFYEPISVRQAD